MKIRLSLACLLLIITNHSFSQTNPLNPDNEVIYHVFQRSFYDSNGDMHGDLNGIRQKLGYLKDLGVTSILLTPLYRSPFFYNYFADDFEKIDPRYGTMQDFINLARAVHKSGMKIYLDMETQYVAEDHPWFKDSYNNPKSKYSDYIWYDDPGNTKPEPAIFGFTTITTYNGITKKIANVNLHNKKVQDYNYRLFKMFADPDGDGNFSDGVDGFRLDHLMDDLDSKGKINHLFAEFWNPLLNSLRKINPKLRFIGEQAYGGYGFECFKQGSVNDVFAFRLQAAIASFNKTHIMHVADSTFNLTPTGNNQVVFIENHDMSRFATVVDKNQGKLRIAAVLNLFIGGIPAIYYGQELGMPGKPVYFAYVDGNAIPQREAFEWYKADTGKGMCLWYKDTGPWWDKTNLTPNDGISLEEEKADPASLWSFYRELLHLRRSNSALASGSYQNLQNNNAHVLTFVRQNAIQKVLVMVNLSGVSQDLQLNPKQGNFHHFNKLYGNASISIMESGTVSVTLPPYGMGILNLN